MAAAAAAAVAAAEAEAASNPLGMAGDETAADEAQVNVKVDADAAVSGAAMLKQDAFEEQASLSSDTEDDYDWEQNTSTGDFHSRFQEAELPLVLARLPAAARIRMVEDVPTPWAGDGLVTSALRHFGEQADVQMCATVLLVLGDARCRGISEAIQEEWLLSYTELLDRWQLWHVRGLVSRLSHLSEVQRLTQVSTTIHASCAGCNKALGAGGICKRCRKPSFCTLCHLPVHDLYVWCQV